MGRVVSEYKPDQPLPERFEGVLVTFAVANVAKDEGVFAFSYGATVYTYHSSARTLRAYDLSNVASTVPYIKAVMDRVSKSYTYFYYDTSDGSLTEAVLKAAHLKRKPRGASPIGPEAHDSANFYGGSVDGEDLLSLLGIDEPATSHPGEHSLGETIEPPLPESREETHDTAAPHRAIGVSLRNPLDYVATLRK